MKIVYSTNLFYRYLFVESDGHTVIEYTENSFYEKLYKYSNIKFKRFPDREEFYTPKGEMFIRKFAYLEIPDYVKVEPFKVPSEVYQKVPDNDQETEKPDFWHNISRGQNKAGTFKILPL